MFLIVYLTLVGLLIGSALNAMVWRLHVGRSWARGRSVCPDCGHTLAAKDLVPVASWLWLRGRCRYCGKRIHWQYPAVELLTAALFGLSAAQLAPQTEFGWAQLIIWLAVLAMLILLAVYDLRWMLLPDKVMLPAIGVAGLYVALLGWHARASWLTAVRGPLLAALLTASVFYLLASLSKGRAMGGGDIKLVFLMGLLLGLKGTLLALVLAFDTGAVIGVALLVTHRKGRRDHIPFGPFLAGGTVVAFLYGPAIINWYLRLNGL